MDNSNSLLGTEKPPEDNSTEQPSIWDGQSVQWPEGFDDTLKESKVLKNYVGEDGNFNYANIMKSYVNLDRMRGGMVKIPTELDTPEDKDRFFEKVLGFNKDPESYTLEAAEKLDPEFQTELKDMLYKSRIPVETAKELQAFIDNKFGEYQGSQLEAEKAKVQEATENLQAKWGEAFDKNIKYAQEVAKNFGGDDFMSYLDQSGIGNDQRLIEFLSDLGSKLYTDAKLTENKQGFSDFGLSASDAQAKLADLQGDPQGPYWNSQHPNHSQAVEAVLKYNEIINKAARAQQKQQYGF